MQTQVTVVGIQFDALHAWSNLGLLCQLQCGWCTTNVNLFTHDEFLRVASKQVITKSSSIFIPRTQAPHVDLEQTHKHHEITTTMKYLQHNNWEFSQKWPFKKTKQNATLAAHKQPQTITGELTCKHPIHFAQDHCSIGQRLRGWLPLGPATSSKPLRTKASRPRWKSSSWRPWQPEIWQIWGYP